MITSIAAMIPMAAGLPTTYCIEGYKLDANDDGISDWIIKLTYADGTQETTTTNRTGFWRFCELDPGTYEVTEVPQEGWYQVEPQVGPYTVTLPTDTGKIWIFKNVENLGTGTPGYWKNHPEAWPVVKITIGGVPYTKTEAIAIMSKPEKGDKTYTMFRALVAAKLSVMIGNDATCIAETIAFADAWMDNPQIDPTDSKKKVKANSEAWAGGEPLYLELDLYNNGDLPCASARD